MKSKIKQYKENKIPKVNFFEMYQGWKAYAKWANASKVRKEILKEINKR